MSQAIRIQNICHGFSILSTVKVVRCKNPLLYTTSYMLTFLTLCTGWIHKWKCSKSLVGRVWLYDVNSFLKFSVICATIDHISSFMIFFIMIHLHCLCILRVRCVFQLKTLWAIWHTNHAKFLYWTLELEGMMMLLTRLGCSRPMLLKVPCKFNKNCIQITQQKIPSNQSLQYQNSHMHHVLLAWPDCFC